MTNKLQQLFPMIKTKEAILEEINSKPHLLQMYKSWKKERQEEFLSFVTGASGVKMLYDSFFKEILNPETVPERLTQLLSLLLGKKVQILEVLPLDNSRIADETSLVIMDIVVKLSDGSIVDVEIQKIGYLFPGQRSACYSADLLLRQYKAARDKKGTKRFSYKNIHKVYTIVFFETSPKPFHSYPNDHLHIFRQTSNTGLALELLQEYYYIPLDIFGENLHNRGIHNDLDAWLAFLSTEDPEIIAALTEYSSVFEQMYRHLYEICQNVEEVMQMFSKELQELDRNTVQLMIDEMQDEIERKAAIIAEMNSTIAEKSNVIVEKENAITLKDNAIAEKDSTIAEKDSAIAEKNNAIAEKDNVIAEKDNAIAEKDSAIAEKDTAIAEKDRIIAELQAQIARLQPSSADMDKPE